MVPAFPIIDHPLPTSRLISSASYRLVPLLLGLVCIVAPPALSQVEIGASVGYPAIGSVGDERLRLDQLLGRAGTSGYLLRSTSDVLSRSQDEYQGTLILNPIRPHLGSVWNSALPHSLNDGALWAGRGFSAALTTGIRARYGNLSVVLAPDIRYEQNRDFDIIYHPDADRSCFAARWHWATLPISIDMPSRFGDEYRAFLGPGQSSITLKAGPVTTGWATDDQWWGPGVRNAILISNNAPGVPRFFVHSAAPLRTPLGQFEFRYSSGRLKESAYFDSIPRNDLRQLSGFAFTFRPGSEGNLTLGAARTVVGPLSDMTNFPERMFSPFLNKGAREEQLASIFARWIFPRAGFETYAEWARHRLPHSLREFLINPNDTQGYTVGLQWARPLRSDSSGILRLQTEITYLEQSTTTRHRPTGSFYTSDRLPQGYTHRGQVIGAAIGPGASSQWIAADYLRDRWQVGLFASRIRWDNDAYYLTQEPSPLDHDVSVLGGLRAATLVSGNWIEIELIDALRYNFMFQNSSRELGAPGDWDIRNYTIRIGLTTGTGSR